MRSPSKRMPANAEAEHVERAAHAVDLREHELLVLLQVGVVRQRQALDDSEQRRQPADRDGRAAAQVLRDLRVLLLRHHARPLGDAVVELGEPELLRRPQHELLGDAREVHEPEGAGVRAGRPRSRGRRSRRPSSGTRASKPRSCATAVGIERQAGARQRAGAERRDVGRGVGRAEPVDVALQRPRVRGQVVAERQRLGALQVRVPGHHEPAVDAGAAPPAPSCEPATRADQVARGVAAQRRVATSPPGRCASARRARSCRSRPARDQLALEVSECTSSSGASSGTTSVERLLDGRPRRRRGMMPCRAEHAHVHLRGADVVGSSARSTESDWE